VGDYEINFNVEHLVSGAYFYQLNVGNEFGEAGKMLLIRSVQTAILDCEFIKFFFREQTCNKDK
jgi:hypothetical protein